MYTHYDTIRHNFKRCVLAPAKNLKKLSLLTVFVMVGKLT